ncbi:hypothetical protein CC80DRAFT_596284, partial [Byssothecium circinans]
MRAERVRQAAVRTVEADAADKIVVRNLEVVANTGMDAWGRPKPQRAFISVTLALAKSFDTAAKADSLDNTTVHYGKLSKEIRNKIQGHKRIMTREAISIIRTITDDTAPDLAATEFDIFYPKGSMFGDGAGYTESTASTGELILLSSVLYLRNLRIPCLIGVNENERRQKQPVVVNIAVENVSIDRVDQYPELETAVVDVSVAAILHSRVERPYTTSDGTINLKLTFVQAISDTSFETLESLSTTVVQELR